MTTLQEQRQTILSSARGILDTCKSAGRELSAAETKSLNEKIVEVKALDERIDLAAQGEAAMRAFGDIDGIGDIDGAQGYADLGTAGLKRIGAKTATAMTT